jgi:predicted acylesterase/phospholipase RssA
MADAIIFAGGAARGAFGAGALKVLLSDVTDLDVRRIVATSSGALNGAYLARAIRSGVERSAGRELERLWIEEGTARHAFDLSVRAIASRVGLSSNARLLALLRENVRPSTARRPIEMRIVVTATAGDVVRRGELAATTFERVLSFGGETFDDADSLEPFFAAVTASAAFPIAFAPVDLALRGERVACYDGGLVNNTPVKHAIADTNVSRIFVITSYPAIFAAHPADRSGVGLALHLGDILINERLYRDLHEARSVNRALALLEARLRGDDLAAVLRALGWTGRRQIEIVEIRPEGELEGGIFDAVFSRELRESYVLSGESAARAALAEITRNATGRREFAEGLRLR